MNIRSSRRGLVLPIALVLPVALALLSAPSGPWAGEISCPNPDLDCRKVLVIPVKFVPPFCPDPGQPCPPSVSLFNDPPPVNAWQLLDLLYNQVNAHFNDWSYGTWQFQYDMLFNPESPDGWWPMPHPLQYYGNAYDTQKCDMWDCVPGYTALVEDAIKEIAGPASQNGLAPSLATYNRFLVVYNKEERSGQTDTRQYPVPVLLPGGAWGTANHTFTASWVQVDTTMDALQKVTSHELSHQLGLWDFYGKCSITETPLAPFVDECNGPWDVMAWDQWGPNHPTGYNKMDLGWIPTDTQRVVMLPVAGTPYGTFQELYPIETIDPDNARVARIPLALPLQNGKFEGYDVECRRAIQGDGALPEEGVLIQLVREAGPGVAIGGYMPARVIHADPPFGPDATNQAALQPGESWVDPVHGINVTFAGYADSSASAPCDVLIDLASAAAQPDPAFFLPKDGISPDLWMDSPLNGYGTYPPSQPLDADGVPSGPGDPFHAGGKNRLWFRVRNLGTAPAPTVGVRVTVEQPATVACNAAPPKIFDETVFLDPIEPGGVRTGYAEVTIPTSQYLRAKVRILPTPGEVTTANNVAERIFNTGTASAVVTSDGPTTVTLGLSIFNDCPGPFPVHIVPKKLPVAPLPHPDPVLDRWAASLPGRLVVQPGEIAPLSLSFTPPFGAAPGEGATIPISLSLFGALNAQGSFSPEPTRQESFLLEIPVVAPAGLTVDVAAGPYRPGDPLFVSGTLSPDQPGTVVGLRFSSASQPEVLVSVPTNGRGSWSATFAPPAPGGWTVRALWQGDDTRSEAEAEGRFLVVDSRSCIGDADCDDANPCTQDICDRSGLCRNSLMPDGTRCDDGDLCTSGDTCLAGSCGQPVVCDDFSAWTADVCDPATGGCLFQPVPLPEIQGVSFVNETTMTWEPGTGASYWNTYRGTIPSTLMSSRRSPYDEACLESDDSFRDGALLTVDRDVPAPGTAWYYRVTMQTAHGEGPLGNAAGVPPNPVTPCMPNPGPPEY